MLSPLQTDNHTHSSSRAFIEMRDCRENHAANLANQA
jgi:hypothetical protein